MGPVRISSSGNLPGRQFPVNTKVMTWKMLKINKKPAKNSFSARVIKKAFLRGGLRGATGRL
jgi:hypothetical protein